LGQECALPNPTHFDDSFFGKYFPQLNDVIIPYFSPPNQIWPLWLVGIDGCKFANLARTKNASEIDLCSSCGTLTGESKDHFDNISSELMLSIIRKALIRNPIPKVHLVICQSLQKTYFGSSKNSFSTAFHGNDIAHKCAYIQVCFGKGGGVIGNIAGLPSAKDPQCLFVFLTWPTVANGR
jgi:hypothetical protein